MDTKTLQEKLARAGFDPGPADGIFGAKTRRAVAAFQKTHQIDVKWPGTVGPKTLAVLLEIPLGSRVPTVTPLERPWYAEALRLKGLQEAAGKRSNPIIMGWAERLGLWYPNTGTPWCGLFLAHTMTATLPNEPLPANPLGARNWLKFGVALEKPIPGCVAVLWRGRKDGWQGHVCLFEGISADGSRFQGLGGNQRDQVRSDPFKTERVLGWRWPSTVEIPRIGDYNRVIGRIAGSLSTNEA